MRKKYRDITVDGKQYAWMFKGSELKIWHNKKLICHLNKNAYSMTDCEEDDIYTYDATVTPRTIATIIRAKDEDRLKVLQVGTNDPYAHKEVILDVYNPYYGDDRICKCGHPYYRHFDSYDNMENVGCKYCDCLEFVEKKDEE